ncbi:sensor histidine kinase [Sorangium sp. So ce1099]|uniref:sensor histidine kinase n=1 Tax=Sorangium sp. So ce1099 TaxID=3133331 RepID=UPI003F5E2095
MTPPSTRLNSRMTWLLAAVLAAAVLLSTSFYSFRSFSRSTELVRRTAAVQVELERLLAALLNAETGERGFLLSGQEEFLEPYHLGITDAESRLARLRELITDEDERRALDGLDALTRQWFALLGELVSLRRQGQTDAALDMVRSRVGKQTLDRIRARVRYIVEAEEGKLKRRQREADESDRVTVLLVSSSGAALALALAVGAVVRKTAEQRRRSDAERDEVLGQMPVGVALAEPPTGGIVYVNPCMKELAGDLGLLDAGASSAERPRTIRRADGTPYVPGELPLSRALRGEVVPHEEMVVAPSAGDEVWILASAAPVYDLEGQLRLGVVVAKDITEQKKAARALAEANEALARLNAELERRVAERTAELEQVNTELEAFSYSVSHDLRAPLRAVAGYCRILEEDYAAALDEEGRSALARALAAARRMGQLIDDLLSLSRLTRAELHPERVDLSELAREVVSALRERDPTRDVDVRIAPGLVDLCDPRLLHVMLENVLGNAWKFTANRARAEVELGVTPRDGAPPVYFVRDNGAGFDMAYAQNLFAPFQRLHAASEFEGTGIGLAIVSRVISKHGGKVWFDAAVGRGATLHFTLAASSTGEA